MTTRITHLNVSGKLDDTREMFEPLFPGLRRLTDGLGVGVTAEVFMQGFGDKVQIPLLESATPFADEFDLGSFGDSERRHLDDATEVEPR